MSDQSYSITFTGLVSGPGIKTRFPVQTVSVINQNIIAIVPGSIISGYTCMSGDRILLTAQSVGSQNGIYIVASSSYRAEDYESGDLSQSYVSVISGTYAGTTWQALGSGIVGTGTQGFVMTNNNVYSSGGIQYSNSATTRAILAAPTVATSLLQMTTAGVPSWISNIPVSLGGTGASSLTSGALLLGSGTAAISTLAPTSYKVLVTDNTPSYALSNTVHLSQIQGAATTANLLSFIDTASAVNYFSVSNSITNTAPTLTAIGTDTNVDFALQVKGTGIYRFLGTSTAPAQLSIASQNTTNAITMRAPVGLSSTTNYVLPLDSTSGRYLSTNGSGVLSFIDAVASFAGRVGAVVPTEGDYTLTQLGDVTITSPTNGQILSYNGSQWINSAAGSGGVTSFAGRTGAVSPTEGDYSLTQLSDVTISSPVLYNYPYYNGSQWINTMLYGRYHATVALSGQVITGAVNTIYYSNNSQISLLPAASVALGDRIRVITTSTANTIINFPTNTGIAHDGYIGTGVFTLISTSFSMIELEVFNITGATAYYKAIMDGAWKPSYQTKNISASSRLQLGDLSNVLLTSPTSGQSLSYNGTNWVNGGSSAPSSFYLIYNSQGNLSQSNYFRVGGGMAGSTYATAAMIMPRATTVISLTLGLSGSPSPGSWIVTLYKNGATTSNGVVASTTSNKAVMSVSFAQYDTMALFITNSNNPSVVTGYCTVELV